MTAATRYRAACAALGLPVWRPGMLSTHGARVLGAGLWASPSGVTCADENLDEEPDLGDPATVGCLLAAVREAWGALSSALPNPYEAPEERWRVFSGDESGDEVACGPTEADALIAALEAAAARRGGQP